MKRTFLMVVVLAILAGCATSEPIYNIENAAIVTGSGTPLTRNKVRRAIVTAVTSKGWVVKDEDAGHMLATLNVRKHMAQVEITYNTRSYSIKYKDSQTLDYDGTKIHRNYNRWIHYMQKNINRQLSAL